MQRTLVVLSLLGVLIGQVQSGRAQGPNANPIQTEVTLKNDSSRKTGGDSTYIELSPVAVPVAYQANTFSVIPNYTRLQSPLLSGLGGQPLNDKTKAKLQAFIEHYYLNNNRHLQDMQSKANPFFSVMNKVFDQFGIPDDLKYLAVIESSLNTRARSYAGAVGTWQFMASTARLLGLTVNSHRDDRKDLYKSTVAAAKYLSQLHAMFGNWMLVIAAYNCGPGRVQQAISSAGSSDFWELKHYLPQQSQKHVMKFLATTYIMKRFAQFFGVENTDIQLGGNKELAFKPITQPLANVALSGKYSLAVIAKYVSMDMMQLEQLNPGLMDKLSKDFSKPHTLFLPADKMILFKASQYQILNESISLMAQNDREKSLIN